MFAVTDKTALKLLAWLGKFEAPKGYDTVFNNRMSDMPKPLTSMTFDEVVADGPRRTKLFGSSAAGRYQFMRDTLDKPVTLDDLKGQLKLSGSELFNKELQDYLGMALLKRRGYDKFMSGKLSVTGFALNLAKEWASLPVLAPTKNGKKPIARGESYYKGVGTNKSLTKADSFEKMLNSIAPGGAGAQSGPGTGGSDPAPLSPAATVAPPPAPASASVGGFLGWLASRFAPRSPGLAPTAEDKALPGDPIVRMVQRELKARNYYLIKVDGWDGTGTRDAVASSRKDNGMGDGGIDQEFLKRLASFPAKPVTEERSKASTAKAFSIAKETAPDLVAPIGTMWKMGGALLTYVGIDTAKTNDLIGKAEQVTGQGGEVLGDIQSAFQTIAGFVNLVVEHRKLILVGIAIWLIWRAANGALKFAIRVKTMAGM